MARGPRRPPPAAAAVTMETSRPAKLNGYRNIGFTGSVSPATKRKLDKREREELQ